MAKMSVSVVKGHGSMAHNNREFTTPNVDVDRTKDNIVYRAEPIEQAYEKCFGAEVARYNSAQKRTDRKINNYMDYIRNSKNGEKLFYETVVQIGNKFDCAVGTENGERAKKALHNYMQDFQRRNPNLYAFNAVLHMDEATPHLHIDYIPLAHGYQRGLQVRNSLDKALKEQGIDGKANKMENSTHNWQESEKNALEGFMRAYGLERAEETGLKRDHMSINQYKAIAEQIRNEVQTLPEQVETTPTIFNKERVTVRKSDIEMLEYRAKLSLVYEQATLKLQNDTAKIHAEEKQYIAEEKRRIANKNRMASSNLQYSEEQLAEANEKLNKARKAYEWQSELNAKYSKLQDLCKTKNQTISAQNDELSNLKSENASLKTQIEENVQNFKNQIAHLTKCLEGMALNLTNVVKAVGLLKYDEGDYKAHLTDKQGAIIDAVAEYAKFWIGKNLVNCPAAETMTAEISEKIGISEGIKSYMPPDYPDILYYKGGEHGRGFYSKDGDYYENLDILPELSNKGITIKDPYELMPGRGRGRGR